MFRYEHLNGHKLECESRFCYIHKKNNGLAQNTNKKVGKVLDKVILEAHKERNYDLNKLDEQTVKHYLKNVFLCWLSLSSLNFATLPIFNSKNAILYSILASITSRLSPL